MKQPIRQRLESLDALRGLDLFFSGGIRPLVKNFSQSHRLSPSGWSKLVPATRRLDRLFPVGFNHALISFHVRNLYPIRSIPIQRGGRQE